MAISKSTGGAGAPKSIAKPAPGANKAIIQASQKAAQKASIKQGQQNIANNYQAMANAFYTPSTVERRNPGSGSGGGGRGTSGGDAGKLPAITQNPLTTQSTNNLPVVETNTTIGAAPNPVKIPSRDVVNLIEPGIDVSTITNLLYENVGATELTKFARHDTVDGINPYYNIISNLSDIKRKYDPSSLISLQKPESSYFDIYSIKLDQRIPDQTYLDQNNLTDYIYVDTNGDLVIELVNLASDEIIEVEIDTSGTIYEVNEL